MARAVRHTVQLHRKRRGTLRLVPVVRWAVLRAPRAARIGVIAGGY